MSAKVFIVTGASRGIGLAIAQCLLREQPSSKLVLVSRSAAAMQRLATSAGPDRVATLSLDMAAVPQAKQAVELALSKFGRLDGVVLNHGTLDPVGRIADADVEAWRGAFDVNVLSGIALIQAALPALREARGRIILTSSGASVRGYAAWGCYGMAKAALNHLALTLANEEKDVTTVSIRPGVVDTQMQSDLRSIHHTVMDKDEAAKFFDAKESGKLLKPEQPGNVIARLAADAPKELSGAFLSWDDKEKLARFQDR